MDRGFHPFCRLPAELRLVIWRLCVPHRVYEIDLPDSDYVFHVPLEDVTKKHHVPCELSLTSRFNALPPVITRVCRESRQVAFETGVYVPMPESPPSPDESLFCQHGRPKTWVDTTHDSAHLHWFVAYQDDFADEPEGHERPAREFAAEAAWLKGPPSLTMSYFYWGYKWHEHTDIFGNPPFDFDLADVLSGRPLWRVVMHTVVVHDATRGAAASGLFGLLGDAPIQVVDVDDERSINAFYDLAEEREQSHDAVVPRQYFRRRAPKYLYEELSKFVYAHHGIDREKLRLRPAIMFRLCPLMCNHIHKVRDEVDLLNPRSETALYIRSQGLGRGRGRGRGGASVRGRGRG